jgi:hypothetical protein
MAGKKFRAAVAQVDLSKLYPLADAVSLAKQIAYAKFDETVEVTMVLGVDPRKADQLVRVRSSSPTVSANRSVSLSLPVPRRSSAKRKRPVLTKSVEMISSRRSRVAISILMP